MTNVLVSIFSAYIWLFPVIFVLAFLKSPFIKGLFGELQVNLAAKFFLDKKTYFLFKNVTLPTSQGTTQIDHIIVSKFGIFVLETKNIKGWIFGDPQQKFWTVKIFRHTSKIQNPLHQNYKHTLALQSSLEIDSEKIFSLVVFVGNSTFKTTMPDNVVYAGQYIRYIKNRTLILFSDSEVENICYKISSGRLQPSLKTHVAHVKHVKSIIESKQHQNNVRNDNCCPKCGKQMVLRTARNSRNQFLGCSGFPACRMTKIYEKG